MKAMTIMSFMIATAILLSQRTCVLHAQIVVSGNENKIGLTTGAPRWIEGARPDSISIIDLSSFPPRVRHLEGIANTVIGPPSNVAITPDGQYALLANSLNVNLQAKPDPWEPSRDVHLIDLRLNPPRIVSSVHAGLQPSGMSITPDGKMALVANRAGGSVSAIGLGTGQLELLQTVRICDVDQSASDVAIYPDGRLALVSVQKGGYLAVLKIDNGKLIATEDKVSVCGQPYRVVITPDGQLGLTAGQGFGGNGIDVDALTVVDVASDPPRTLDFIPLGAMPESIEVSPDGQWVAAVLMAGSNFAEGDARRTEYGQLVMLRREGKSYTLVQRHDVGRIPEGVAFTGDGRYLLVQCHPDRKIWVFRVVEEGVEDTGHRVAVPGMPSSLRAAP